MAKAPRNVRATTRTARRTPPPVKALGPLKRPPLGPPITREAIHRVTGRLLVNDTRDGLVNATIRAFDTREQPPRGLALARSDHRGWFDLGQLPVSITEARLMVFDHAGRPIHEALVRLSDQPAEIAVKTPLESGRTGPMAPLTADGNVLSALDRLGLKTLVDVANTTRGTFLKAIGDHIGADAAKTLHAKATVQRQVLNAAFSSTLLSSGTNAVFDALSSTWFGNCGCSECRSALSERAYLTELMAYTIEKFKQGEGSPISVDYLTREFCQPFDRLTTTCRALTEPVRQVRIAIEVLRRHLTGQYVSPATRVELIRNERTYCLAAYRLLLNHIGTSYEELRELRTTPVSGLAQAAARLGIAPDRIAGLVLDVDAMPDPFDPALDPAAPAGSPQPNTEATLETLFGLADTRKADPTSPIAEPLVGKWQQERLRRLWLEQDRPPDAYSAATVCVIDPDVIGPDDFLAPVRGSLPFDIWFRRRQWLDARLVELRTIVRADGTPDLDAMFERMRQTVAYRTSTVTPWPLASLSELDDIDTSLASDPDTARALITTTLRLTEDAHKALMRIRDIDRRSQVDSRAPSVETAEWLEVAAILSGAMKNAVADSWLAEERQAELTLQRVLLGPYYFTASLREPPPGAWPPPAESPMLDPDSIDLHQMPDGIAGARARELWQQRRAGLDEFRHSVSSVHNAAGVDGMLSFWLDTITGGTLAPDDLQPLLAAIEGNDPVAAATAEAAVINALRLEAVEFAGLLSLTARDESAALEGVSAGEWEDLYDVLTRSWKRSVAAVWIAEEGPLAYWQTRKAALPRWRTSTDDRQRWRTALQQRSAAPIVDPDTLSLGHLAHPHPTNSAFKIWTQRRADLDALAARLDVGITLANLDAMVAGTVHTLDLVEGLAGSTRAVRAAGGLDAALIATLGRRPDFTALNNALTGPDAIAARDARLALAQDLFLSQPAFVFLRDVDSRSQAAQPVSVTEWNQVDLLLSMAQLTRAFQALRRGTVGGGNIQPRLDQLRLSAEEYFELCRVRALLAAESPVLADEWQGLQAILRQVWKRQRFGDWQAGEATARLVLGPDDFVPLESPAGPWVERLQARIAQSAEATAILRRAVSETEEALLTSLRDAIIAAANTGGGSLDAEAVRLGRWLLIDMQTAGCAVITRVTQAAQTLQSLLWSARTGQLGTRLTNRQMSLAHFDEEWIWIGSYPAWRAAMVAFLYPENLLLPQLRRRQSPAFVELLDRLRETPDLTADDVSAAVAFYFAYFKDVCALSLRASCRSPRLDDGDPGPREFFLFARATSGAVYWSCCDQSSGPAPPTTQTFWSAVPGLGAPASIIGAAPYRIGGRRFVYLFVMLDGDRARTLAFTRYDVATGEWDARPTVLDLPSDDIEPTVVLSQCAEDDRPPRLLVHAPQVGLFYRAINHEGTAWDSRSASSATTTTSVWGPFAIGSYSGSQIFQLLAGSEPVPGRLTIAFEFNRGSAGQVITLTWVTGFEWRADYRAWIPLTGFELPPGASWMGIVRRPSPEHLHVFYGAGGDAYYTGLAQLDSGQWTQFGPIIFPRWSGFEELTVHGGSNEIDAATTFVAYQWPQLGAAAYRVVVGGANESFWPEFGTTLISTQSTPLVVQPPPLELPPIQSASALDERRETLRLLYGHHLTMGDRSNFDLLEEAYYSVPMVAALQLQGRGEYVSALDWYRSVYDYCLPADQRKIYPGLRAEETIASDFTLPDEWLRDPWNPHAIAAMRAEAYTKYTLLSLVRCLIDYADDEFTADTVETRPRAAALYRVALDLLNGAPLAEAPDECEGLLNQVNGVIQQQVQSGSAWAPVWARMLDRLPAIQEPAPLRRVLTQITSAIEASQADDVTFEMAHTAVEEAVAAAPPALGLTARLAAADALRQDGYRALLDEPRVAMALESIGDAPLAPLGQGGGVVLQGGTIQANTYLPGVPFSSCRPRNPLPGALRQHAETNLHKLLTCRNIAGMSRTIPDGGITETVSSVVIPLEPTVYRYKVLLDRTRQLVQTAVQLEEAMLRSLEKRDAESYTLLKARQDAQLAQGQVRVHDSRVREARGQVTLAALQQQRATIQRDHYRGLIRQGLLATEQEALRLMQGAVFYQFGAAVISYAAAFLPSSIGVSVGLDLGVSAAYSPQGMMTAVSSSYSSAAGAFSTLASIASTKASHSRRQQEWYLQNLLGEQDMRIGDQQRQIAEDHVRVSRQERELSAVQARFAEDVVQFLGSKFTNVDLYDWMSGVLERTYRFFLQQATATARLAENQLAFERQIAVPGCIQPDYWRATDGPSATATDRKGLTGSARLLRDVQALDDFAFHSDRRLLELSSTLSLARIAPVEFQRFRETGQLIFATTLDMFDRDFPGHYVRLMKRVKTSVVALVPPSQGIHASLSTLGLSRVVAGDTFETRVIRRMPELVALSSPRDTAGVFELKEESGMRLPFEGMGLDATWELRMPKASNPFDFRTIADVMVTFEYTALDSDEYRRQVIARLDRTISAERGFSLRFQCPDAWYDLHHQDPAAPQIVVRFDSRREDYPPNLTRLRIEHVTMYFGRSDSQTFEVDVAHLRFVEQGQGGGPGVGGGARTRDGIISTRAAGGAAWLGMIDRTPIGRWELALPNTEAMRRRLSSGLIEDILLAVTYTGQAPDWPA